MTKQNPPGPEKPKTSSASLFAEDPALERWLTDAFDNAETRDEPWLESTAQAFNAQVLAELDSEPLQNKGVTRLRLPLLACSMVVGAIATTQLTSAPELSSLLASVSGDLAAVAPEIEAVELSTVESWLRGLALQLPTLLMAPLLAVAAWAFSTAAD